MAAPPITAADVSQDWIDSAAEAIARYGQPTRAGDGNTIEVKRINDGTWMPLMLPTNATEFMTAIDRDTVLAAIIKATHRQ